MDVKNVLQKAKDLQEQAKEAGRETAQAAVDGVLAELQGLKPLLAQCGFALEDIAISLALPPSCVVTILHNREASGSLEEIAARDDLSKMQVLIVKALQSAYSFNGTFAKYGYGVGKLSLGISLMPSVSVHLVSAAGP